MLSCIKCGREGLLLCDYCADELVDKMSYHDQLAHALVGRDALAQKPNLMGKLKEYKKLTTKELEMMFWVEK